jgi:drug/metabolite transporter (DMT)-like permease
VCAAISWGTGDFAGGLATRRGHVAVTMFVSQSLGFVVCLVLVLLFREPVPDGTGLFWAAAGGAAGICGLAGFYAALSRGTMGLVAPLTALIAATVPSVVGIVNGTPLTPLLVLGIVIALAAVVVISLPDSEAALGIGRPSLSAIRGSERSEILLVVIAGLGFAGFFMGIAAAHNAGAATWWSLMVVRIVGMVLVTGGVVALALSGRRFDLTLERSSLPLAGGAGIGDLSGNLFYLAAIEQTSLPTAVVLSSLYPVQTTLLARAVLGERLTAVRAGGVVLAIVAIVVVSLGSIAV